MKAEPFTDVLYPIRELSQTISQAVRPLELESSYSVF